MDTIVEQLVIKKRKAADIAKIILTILMAILLPLICILLAYKVQAYFIYISFFVFLICIYLAWYIITSQYVEFEYAITNNNITVDKIIAKRKRKKLLDLDIRQFENLCKITDSKVANKKFTKYTIAAQDIDSNETYVATYHSEAYGNCALFFTPSDKVLEAMRPYLKREIMMDLFYKK